MNPEILSGFREMYTTLAHAEAYVVCGIMDPSTSWADVVEAHNVLEEAKKNLVQAYLPFTVRTNVVTREKLCLK